MELMMASTCLSLPSSTLASLGIFCSGPTLGSMSQLLERAHFADLAKLIAKIFQRESFVAKFAFQVERGFFVDRLFGAFDERHDVAHAKNARDDSLRIKTF